MWLKRADGTDALFETSKSPLFSADGDIIGIIGVFHDITKRREREDALQASEEKYRMIAENTSDSIWLYNLDQDRFTYYSPSVQQLRGLTVEEALAEKILDTVTPEFKDVAARRILEAKNYFVSHPGAGRIETIELKQPSRFSDGVWVEVSAKLRFNDQHEIEILGVSRNIDNRKKIESEIIFLGYHDQLTGLYNRHHFETIITEEMDRSDRYNVPLSMLMIDLDNFKVVNDTWGHPVGDDLLKLTAKVIKKTIRGADIAIRLGGEEFIVLTPQTDKYGAAEAAEKIRAAIEKEPHPIAGVRTVSVGAAQRMSNESYRHWYRRLDDALYLAKENGRNKVVISDENEILPVESVRIHWQPEWESGNNEIDKQHQELIEITNELLNMSFAGRDSQATRQQIELLLNHIVHHFEYEESLLVKVGFPTYMTHANIHKGLVAKALRLTESYDKGEVKVSAFFSFIVDDVIVGHLADNDVGFFSFVQD